jgi:hypothetical protein
MKLITDKIKTKEDFDNFSIILANRVINNQPISENSMLDGFIIGFILTTPFVEEFLRGKEIGRVLDGTIQKLEQVEIWITNNEKVICNLI